MSVSKIIEAQISLFADLEKRFGEPPKDGSDGADISAKAEQRIKLRLERLKADRKTTVSRYDAAIAAEETALKHVVAKRPKIPNKPG